MTVELTQVSVQNGSLHYVHVLYFSVTIRSKIVVRHIVDVVSCFTVNKRDVYGFIMYQSDHLCFFLYVRKICTVVVQHAKCSQQLEQ